MHNLRVPAGCQPLHDALDYVDLVWEPVLDQLPEGYKAFVCGDRRNVLLVEGFLTESEIRHLQALAKEVAVHDQVFPGYQFGHVAGNQYPILDDSLLKECEDVTQSTPCKRPGEHLWFKRPTDEVLNAVESRIAAVTGIPASEYETPMQFVHYERPFEPEDLEVQLKASPKPISRYQLEPKSIGAVQVSLRMATSQAQTLQSIYPAILNKSEEEHVLPRSITSGFRVRIRACGANQVDACMVSVGVSRVIEKGSRTGDLVGLLDDSIGFMSDGQVYAGRRRPIKSWQQSPTNDFIPSPTFGVNDTVECFLVLDSSHQHVVQWWLNGVQLGSVALPILRKGLYNTDADLLKAWRATVSFQHAAELELEHLTSGYIFNKGHGGEDHEFTNAVGGWHCVSDDPLALWMVKPPNVHHDKNREPQRQATAILYLSQTGGGGETLFPALRAAVTPLNSSVPPSFVQRQNRFEKAFQEEASEAKRQFVNGNWFVNLQMSFRQMLSREMVALCPAAREVAAGIGRKCDENEPEMLAVHPGPGRAVFFMHEMLSGDEASWDIDPIMFHTACIVTAGEKWAMQKFKFHSPGSAGCKQSLWCQRTTELAFYRNRRETSSSFTSVWLILCILVVFCILSSLRRLSWNLRVTICRASCRKALSRKKVIGADL